MTAIERAEALLEAATEAPCTHGSTIGTCCAARINARQCITEMGFTPGALCGYIGAVKGLEDGLVVFDPLEETAWAKSVCQAVADFERLFPETNERQS